MMQIDSSFHYKKANHKKLIEFGFVQKDGQFVYETSIVNGQFVLRVFVKGDCLRTQVIDPETDEEYVLHRIAEVCGGFVGLVRTDYETLLNEIAARCFETDVFKSNDAKKILEYVAQKYGDELEFLWKNSNNAILRRKDTNKWYAAFLVLSRRKLGFDSDGMIEVLNLRVNPEELKNIVDHQKYFPAFHMNKKHWCSICLDGSLSTQEIESRMDNSYTLAVK